MDRQQVQLLLNEDGQGHGDSIKCLLVKAKQIECMIAFAKMSGLKTTLPILEKSLGSGLKARFAIGLDFYQTDPELLRQLFKLSRRFSLELYLSNSTSTFHPKIYAISYGKSCTVLIGSANLTGGGLWSNYEASAQVKDLDGALFRSVRSHIDDLVNSSELVEATPKRIAEYERRHLINQAQQRLAKQRTKEAIKRTENKVGADTQTLSEILHLMREDTSEKGFDASMTLRNSNRARASRKIAEIGNLQKVDPAKFVRHYEELIGYFHSGGLHRGKNIIANSAALFRTAVAALMDEGPLTPGTAYKLLHNHFQHIPRAGVNVITEVLHAIDSQQYAVMNKNAVSGLRLAGIWDFPMEPNKATVSSEEYEHFCQQANVVRKALKLADFSELDALFNYAYWQ